jgi:thiol-disulfide isomerase/thioredoxin
LRAGHRAPDFALARLEKGDVQGTAHLGKLLADGPVLLAFFKSTCPVCQMTLPFLERIHRGRAPGSLEIYGVSQDDQETTEEFAGEFGIVSPCCWIPRRAAIRPAMPTAFRTCRRCFWWSGIGTDRLEPGGFQ